MHRKKIRFYAKMIMWTYDMSMRAANVRVRKLVWEIAALPYTVKTLYNVTRYNRIFNIRHKIAGNGSVSNNIPSL